MMNFNKEHVTSTMLENDPDLKRTNAEDQLDSVLTAIIETLEKGKSSEPNKKGIRAKLTMVGFGTFMLKAIPRRKHRSPQTQMEVFKEAHNEIKFKGGKTYSDSVN